MIFPVNQPYKITTLFSASHPGIDIAPIPAGAGGVPCFAPERSRVIASAYLPAVEGEYVKLLGLDSGKYYYFGHFAKNSRTVTVGQNIAENTVIGTLGMTGLADGVHTHFEVRNTSNGSQIDPLGFFNSVPAQKGQKMLDDNGIINMYLGFVRYKPEQKDLDFWRGKPYDTLQAMLMNSSAYADVNRLIALGKDAERGFELVSDSLYKKKG